MKKLLFFLLLAIASPLLASTNFDIRIPAQFSALVSTNAELKWLATGMGFCEGPIWRNGDKGVLVFSDIPHQRLMQWSDTEKLSVYRTNSHSANGNCLDLEGRLLSCEMGARDVVREEPYGKMTVLADRFGGRKFNAPNDIVVKSDHSIWFTDPDYGLPKGQSEQPGLYVYRIDAKTTNITVVAADCDHPNGICFSPDESTLYVADSGHPHDIHSYEVRSDGTLSSGRLFSVVDKGVPDGMRCDKAGNLFSSAGDGVQIFNPKGELIGKILVPETPANLAFGGRDGHTLYITARTSLYSIDVLTKGAK